MSSIDLARQLVDQDASGPEDLREFPFISIIVPTYNRARTLPFLFSALARQLYPATALELIVVDNSSSDDTESVVGDWARSLPFPVSFYRKDNKGPAASRNYGAARARGDILAFTDSDCIPVPLWLRNAARAVELGAGIVCGPFLPIARTEDRVLSAQQPAVTYDRGCYPTANLFVKRKAFLAVGGFDEKFGLYPWGEMVAGEDTDLAWRVRRTGEQAIFREDAIVCHLATPIKLTHFLLRPIVVQIIPRLLPKIPELRRMYLWKRYFLSPVHLYFYLALLGVTLALITHQWLSCLLALPWLYHHGHFAAVCIRWEGVRGITRALLLVYNQVACSLVLMLASIRYRRIVL